MLTTAQVNIIKNAVKNAGITPPTTTPIPPFPKPNADAQTVIEAIINSTKPNPYADPKVQTALTEYQASRLGELENQYHALKQREQAAQIEEQIAALLEQVRNKFEEAAAQITNAGQTIGYINDPADIVLNSASATAQAAVAAIQARETIKLTVNAWKVLHQTTGNGTVRDERFVLGELPAELLTRYRKLQINTFDAWDLVREGMPLALAETPGEANRRLQAVLDELNKVEEAPRVNYLTGERIN